MKLGIVESYVFVIMLGLVAACGCIGVLRYYIRRWFRRQQEMGTTDFNITPLIVFPLILGFVVGVSVTIISYHVIGGM